MNDEQERLQECKEAFGSTAAYLAQEGFEDAQILWALNDVSVKVTLAVGGLKTAHLFQKHAEHLIDEFEERKAQQA